jgi:hypothetical protein
MRHFLRDELIGRVIKFVNNILQIAHASFVRTTGGYLSADGFGAKRWQSYEDEIGLGNLRSDMLSSAM